MKLYMKNIVGRKENKMIIVAMTIGYVLGVLPFLFFYALNGQIRINKPSKEEKSADNVTEELVNEWLNGETKQNEEQEKQMSQKAIYDEIVTGVAYGGKE